VCILININYNLYLHFFRYYIITIFIANPNYYEDNHPHNFEPMTAVGFELWTMQNQIMFDNIYIGHSEADAEEFANQTWAIKNKIEMVEVEKNTEKEKVHMIDSKEPGFKDKLATFIEEFKKDPVSSFKKNPFYGTIAVIICAFPFVSLLLINSPKKKSIQDTLDELKENKEKAEDAETEEKPAEVVESNNVEENVTTENIKQRTKAEDEEENEEKKDEE